MVRPGPRTTSTGLRRASWPVHVLTAAAPELPPKEGREAAAANCRQIMDTLLAHAVLAMQCRNLTMMPIMHYDHHPHQPRTETWQVACRTITQTGLEPWIHQGCAPQRLPPFGTPNDEWWFCLLGST